MTSVQSGDYTLLSQYDTGNELLPLEDGYLDDLDSSGEGHGSESPELSGHRSSEELSLGSTDGNQQPQSQFFFSLSQSVCYTKFCTVSRKLAVFLLTNVIVSVFTILLGLCLTGGLLYYTIFVHQPKLVIDKSLNSFNIPNHEVSIRADGLRTAIEDMYSKSRRRRDLQSGDKIQLNQAGTLDEMLLRKRRNAQKFSDMTLSDGGTKLRHSRHVDFFLDYYIQGKTSRNNHVLKTRNVRRKKQKSPGEIFYEKHFEPHLKREQRSAEGGTFLGRVLNRIRRHTSGTGSQVVNSYEQVHLTWRMMLVYIAKGGDENIFSKDRIETVHKIEKDIMSNSKFTDFCWRYINQLKQDPALAQIQGCMPPNSLMTYFYPSVTPNGDVHYDGLGNNIIENVTDGLKRAMSKETFYWFVDETMNHTNMKSRYLRTEVYFGTPLKGYASHMDRRPEQNAKFKEFVVTYVNKLDRSSTSKVQVLYGGNEIFDYEVDQTFKNDMFLAISSACAIFIMMLVLTSFSVWLSFIGLLSVVMCFPMALFFYHVVFGIEALGILNGAASFLIIGIGCDDVFVFINTFRQAHHMKDVGTRFIHTVTTAGLATFFTSFTTAAAFAANVPSSIPALHEFGLFMCLIVACCWVVVMIMLPPALNIWYRFFSKCERLMCICCGQTCKGHSSVQLPTDVQHFLSGDQTSTAGSQSEDSSNDVPLLQLDDGELTPVRPAENDEDNDEDDDMLLMLEEELHQSLIEEGRTAEGCGLTVRIQAILYHYVAVPVIHARFFVIGGFLIMLAVSIGLITQLTPATKPPQLFKENTNLQQLLDLKANLSADGISCVTCSGIFKEQTDQIHKAPTYTTPQTHHNPAMNPTTARPALPPGGATPAHQDTPVTRAQPIIPYKSTPKPKTTPSRKFKTTTGSSTSAAKTTTATPTTTTTTTTTTSTSTSTSMVIRRATTVYPILPVRPSHATEASVEDLDPCANGKCAKAASRPVLESSATVYVVFGIRGLERTGASAEHVLSSKDTPIYDEDFAAAFNMTGGIDHIDTAALRDLCKICHLVANNSELVKPGSAQCLPSGFNHNKATRVLRSGLQLFPECANLPGTKYVNNKAVPQHAFAKLNSSGLFWIAFAFESTTAKGQSYYGAYKQYEKWEKFINHIKTLVLPKDSPLKNMYQTSEFWTKVFMERVAVGSAIYGLVLSMLICIAAVAVFTGHVLLLLIICLTISGVILLVVSVFYLSGWELGAVEAVSLSILVGSSVDYCVHLVEGYLLAGIHPPHNIRENTKSLRQWRAKVAVSHIGSSIFSSAVTTIVAAIPLTQTTIQPFAKFGEIVAINTSVAILYTFTACTAFLSLFGPAKFKRNAKSSLLSFVCTGISIGAIVLVAYLVDRFGGVTIPGPSGKSLFT
ncbi:protein dispatched homolog 3 isoform X1 [Lingula anatina]|uniref:Protein dispatched homolog 3 isoform X1 n=1 Tax=Lingula anatina TaxID=7574 RepID=A0A1S3JP32_LINAN|nr:protein dispatched homolog 3 isoform X1 [Lingula anatina]|eukprot:XP_013412125.1 protein dispatched homolog 3 isoform X1 [Lingula anatina]